MKAKDKGIVLIAMIRTSQPVLAEMVLSFSLVSSAQQYFSLARGEICYNVQ